MTWAKADVGRWKLDLKKNDHMLAKWQIKINKAHSNIDRLKNTSRIFLGSAHSFRTAPWRTSGHPHQKVKERRRGQQREDRQGLTGESRWIPVERVQGL